MFYRIMPDLTYFLGWIVKKLILHPNLYFYLYLNQRWFG